MKIDWKGFYKEWLSFMIYSIIAITICASVITPSVLILIYIEGPLGMVLLLLWLMFIVGMIVSLIKNVKS